MTIKRFFCTHLGNTRSIICGIINFNTYSYCCFGIVILLSYIPNIFKFFPPGMIYQLLHWCVNFSYEFINFESLVGF